MAIFGLRDVYNPLFARFRKVSWGAAAMRACMLLGLGMGGESCWAQAQVMAAPQSSAVSGPSPFDTQISMRGESFINPNFRSGGSNNFTFYGASVESKGESKDSMPSTWTDSSLFQMSITGEYNPEVSFMSYLNVREMDLRMGQGIYLGRKLENWSDLDERWHLGFYQPQFRWNPLLPESQGLTGLFVNLKISESSELPVGLKLFGSFLYVPDQGAGYQIQDGQFSTQNPWFAPLPKQVDILQGDRVSVSNQTAYNLHMPDQNQVVLNSSFAAEFYIGQPQTGFSAKAGMAYKPSNALMFAANSASNPQGITTLDLYPEIYDQTLVSADLSYKYENFEIAFGALNETPSAPLTTNGNTTVLNTLTYRVYSPRTLLSPLIGMHWGNLSVAVSYLEVQGTDDNPIGAQAPYLGTFLPAQLNFGSAARIDAGYESFIGARRGWSFKTSYLQGTTQDFSMWTLSALWKMTRSWSFTGFTNLVEANTGSNDPTVFQNYVTHNEVGLGVRYAL
jgi:hypothetical protein